MSKGIIDTIIGGVEIAAGILVIVGTLGGGTALGVFLIAAGAGMVFTGVGTLLAGNNLGVVSASRNPISPWVIVYGRARVGGTVTVLKEEG
jgi:hypothetical protein